MLSQRLQAGNWFWNTNYGAKMLPLIDSYIILDKTVQLKNYFWLNKTRTPRGCCPVRYRNRSEFGNKKRTFLQYAQTAFEFSSNHFWVPHRQFWVSSRRFLSSPQIVFEFPADRFWVPRRPFLSSLQTVLEFPQIVFKFPADRFGVPLRPFLGSPQTDVGFYSDCFGVPLIDLKIGTF